MERQGVKDIGKRHNFNPSRVKMSLNVTYHTLY